MEEVNKKQYFGGERIRQDKRVMPNLYNWERSKTIKGLREDTLIIKPQLFAQFMKLSHFQLYYTLVKRLSPQEEGSCNITNIYSNGSPLFSKRLKIINLENFSYGNGNSKAFWGVLDAGSALTLKPKDQKCHYGTPGRVGYDPFPLTIPQSSNIWMEWTMWLLAGPSIGLLACGVRPSRPRF